MMVYTPEIAIDIEKSLLGAVLLYQESLVDVMDSGVTDDSFYLMRHNTIYRTMVDIYTQGENIDNATVTDKLAQQNKLDDVGGWAYLSELMNCAPSGFHAISYAMQVKEHEAKRNALKTAQTIAESVNKNDSQGLAEITFNAVMELFEHEHTRNEFMLSEALVNFDLKMRSQRGLLVDGLLGHTTGLKDIDRILCGLRPDFLYTLTGRTGLGKTALALQCAKHVASAKPHPAIGSNLVVYFSTEMSEDRVGQRLLANEMRINSLSLQFGDLNGKEAIYEKSFTKLANLPIVIVDARGYSVHQIKQKAESIRRRLGQIGLIVVDLLNDVRAPGSNSDGRKEELGYIIRELKTMSSTKKRMFEFGCPVMAVAQSNRETMKTGRLSLFGLADAADLEHSSDCVMGIYQPSEDDDNVLGFEVMKHRDGDVGSCQLYYQKECYYFGNFQGDKVG